MPQFPKARDSRLVHGKLASRTLFASMLRVQMPDLPLALSRMVLRGARYGSPLRACSRHALNSLTPVDSAVISTSSG